jgi:CRP-like cAMP-binding protein
MKNNRNPHYDINYTVYSNDNLYDYSINKMDYDYSTFLHIGEKLNNTLSGYVKNDNEYLEISGAFNLDIFDKRYFNYFKHISLKRNEELFKQCTLRKDIFFIKEGEIELYFKGCFKDINKILTQKGVKIDIAKEILMTKTHPRYKEFYFEKRIEFKLFHCGSKEAIGLDEIVFDNELLYCCGKCSSDKAELFAIELKLFNEIIMNENRKKKVQEYITQRTDMMVKRLLHIKNITMKGMFHML